MASTKKILFINNSSFFSGAEKILFNIINGLFEKRIYSLYMISGSNGELFEKTSSLGIKTHLIDMNFKIRSLRIFKHILVSIKIISFIRKNNIDLVYCNRAIVGKYGSVAKIFTGVKCIWHLHDFHNQYWGEKFAYFTDLMISVSNSVRNSFPENLSSKIKVIHNGLKINRDIVQDPKLINKLRLDYDLNENDFIVTLPGRIIEWKGQEFFINTAKIILEKKSYIKFIILGDVVSNLSVDESYKIRLIDLVNTYNLKSNIIFTGWKNNAEEIIGLSDIIVNCSLVPEPLATTIIEAMHMGKPIVCLDSGGNSEMVINNENGIVVKKNDAPEFAESILKIIEDRDLYTKMSGKSLERAKYFSYETFITNIKSCINSVID